MKNVFVAAVGVLLLSAVGCERDSDSPTSPSPLPSIALRDLVTSMAAQSNAAASRSGTPPASAGGPTVVVSGNQRVLNGGTLTATLTSASLFQTIYLHIGSRTVGLVTEAAGGIDGFYELRLPTPRASASVLLEFAQVIPLAELDLLFAVADPSGVVGPYVGLTTAVTPVGTGDVQVTLAWDADSDVDLHVVDPAGEEIYYSRRRSASGGELDLDSNAACRVDGVRNENITWPVGRAPRGTYTVRVDYWSSCNVAQTNYTVRVISEGINQTFSGSFSGAGDQGGPGSGRLITTFQRSTGPAVQSGSMFIVPSVEGIGEQPKTAAPPKR
jgi:hypothetical protein